MYTKIFSGKQSIVNIANYLERGEFSVCWFGINEEEHNSWGAEFENFYLDSVLKHTDNAMHYKHLIISPNPNAHVRPEDLADAVDMALFDTDGLNAIWAGVIHTDTDVVHCHVVIPNVDLEQGGYLKYFKGTSYENEKKLSDLRLAVGDILKELGYSDAVYAPIDLQRRYGQKYVEEKRHINMDELNWQREKSKWQNLSRGEKEMLYRGMAPVKEILRSHIDVAKAASSNMREFKQHLQNLGVEVSTNKYGKWQYALSATPDFTISANSLGKNFTQKRIEEVIQRGSGQLNLEVQNYLKNRYFKVEHLGTVKGLKEMRRLAQVANDLRTLNITNYPDLLTYKFQVEGTRDYYKQSKQEDKYKKTSLFYDKLTKVVADTRKYQILGNVEELYPHLIDEVRARIVYMGDEIRRINKVRSNNAPNKKIAREFSQKQHRSALSNNNNLSESTNPIQRGHKTLGDKHIGNERSNHYGLDR